MYVFYVYNCIHEKTITSSCFLYLVDVLCTSECRKVKVGNASFSAIGTVAKKLACIDN